MIGQLPRQLEVDGKMYDIRTDYRNCLLILEAFNDPENTLQDAYAITLSILYKDIPENTDEAIDKAIWFLNCGDTLKEEKPEKPLMNWKQDEQMIFAAINKVAGHEIRLDNYMHFWTFIGLFQGIGDGFFSAVLHIRQKLNKGKKLDKTEKEFYKQNKSVIDIKQPLSDEEKERRDFINKMFS